MTERRYRLSERQVRQMLSWLLGDEIKEDEHISLGLPAGVTTDDVKLVIYVEPPRTVRP